MKKTKLKMLRSLFVIVLILYGITYNTKVQAKTVTDDMSAEITTCITHKIEKKTKSVVVDDFKNIQDVTTYYSDSLNIDSNDMNNISIGHPFIIYSLTDSNQSEIYYYPIINDRNKEVVVTVEVLRNADIWTYNIGTEYVEYLNRINYCDNEYIFYSYEDVVYYDNGNQSISLYGNGIDIEEVKNFQQLDFSKKIEAISNRISTFELKMDSQSQSYNSFELKAGYTPIMKGNTCHLYNPVGQGPYNLCWAASVATIVNYRNGTNLTAMNVANAEGVGYNSGGLLTNVVNSLHRYGLTDYSAVSRTLTWTQIYENIMNLSKPFYMACYYDFTQMGHAVICLGCKEYPSYQYIIIWNPGKENGAGGSTILKYYQNATTLSYDNKTWVWYDTVSSYN